MTSWPITPGLIVNQQLIPDTNPSEDNMSFDDIQEEAARKHRIKNSWMYKDETVHLERKAQVLVVLMLLVNLGAIVPHNLCLCWWRKW